MSPQLVTTQELLDHLEDQNWVIVDCRFDLSKPEWGLLNYQEGHIPGAVYASLDKDLAGPITPQTGRHPLPAVEAFISRLEAWGITPKSQVIVYDGAGGGFAARLWFMLKWIGHEKVALLNGGFARWKNDGFPIKSGAESQSPAVYPMPTSIHWERIVNADEIDSLRHDPAYVIIDARAPERYRGDVEPIDTIAGRIPGAVNRFHGQNLDANGLFKSPEMLKAEFSELIKSTPPENIIVYCGSGVTSCHHLIALESIGLPAARIFIGSWSEWIRKPEHAILKS